MQNNVLSPRIPNNVLICNVFRNAKPARQRDSGVRTLNVEEVYARRATLVVVDCAGRSATGIYWCTTQRGWRVAGV